MDFHAYYSLNTLNYLTPNVAINKIDRPMIESWVSDLVFVKTFIGLRFQGAILRKVAEARNEEFRLSTIEEEVVGIDGFISERPVSIKPDTYRVMAPLPEFIGVDFIFYTKLKNGIRVDWEFCD